MKKIIAIFCAVMLVATCSISVFAADNGKITINNTIEGQDYSIYKMADLSLSTDGKAYTYTALDAWVDFFKTQSTYFDIDEETMVVTAKGEIDADGAAAIAAAAKTYVSDNDIDATKTMEAASATVAFENLELGYYLIGSSVGAFCMLGTTDTEFTKDEKNDEPTVTKEVKEGDVWGAENDDNFFATVNFKTTINVVDGAVNYVLHDAMDAGLDFVGITSVTVDGVAVGTANYTVKTGEELADADCDFEIAFENDYVSTISGMAIVVEYTATINENAVVGGEGNNNTTYLVYGENSDLETEPADTTTYVYRFGLVKTDEADKVLDGAKFKLYDAATGGSEIAVVKTADGAYRVAKEGETGVVIETVNGEAVISGLDSATYYLEETIAPAGYNKLTERKSVSIDKANNDATVTEGVYDQGGVQVINKTGAILPETGSFGTTMFIVIGALVALFAGIFFVTRVRMSKVVD